MMKFGIDKLLLIGCLGAWGTMLAERSDRDPRCSTGTCTPSYLGTGVNRGAGACASGKCDGVSCASDACSGAECAAECESECGVGEGESGGEKESSAGGKSSAGGNQGSWSPNRGEDSQRPGMSQAWKQLVQEGQRMRGRETSFLNSRAQQRSQYASLKAFRDAIGESWKSTVQILSESKQVALGVIAREDGWIVTKSSEVPDAPVDVRLHDGTRFEGSVKIRRPELDLALIKVERKDLPTIQWDTQTQVPLGGWIASADSRSLPIAMGVVSVKSRTIPKSDAKLGIKLTVLGQNPQVENVVFGSGADRAGIKEGDTILRIEGAVMGTGQEVLNTLMSLPAGKRILVDVERDGKELAFQAQMMDLTLSMLDPTEMEVNGNVSARSTGFRNVIQHDTVLSPQHCGGPLIDVDGNVVGLNIARAGRVCCYALPANTVSKAIGEMLETVVRTQEEAIRVETLKPGLELDNSGLEIKN